MEEVAIFAGSANPALAESIANILGLRLGARVVERFPDSELHVGLEETVRNCDVYLVQPTGPPVDRNLMELFFLADACRRAGADTITALIPYFGYARQDRRARGREAVGARLISDMVKTAGIGRVVAIDLHTTSLEGVFGIPLEQLSAVGLLCNALSDMLAPDSVVVSPDLGAVKLAERYAKALHLPLAIVHKVRTSAETVEVRSVIGEVRGRMPVIVDDMISTGGTIAAAVKALLAAGCHSEVLVAASHGLLTTPARLTSLPIKRLLLTDCLQLSAPSGLPLTVISVAPLLSEVISRLHLGQSLGDLVVHG